MFKKFNDWMDSLSYEVFVGMLIIMTFTFTILGGWQ